MRLSPGSGGFAPGAGSLRGQASDTNGRKWCCHWQKVTAWPRSGKSPKGSRGWPPRRAPQGRAQAGCPLSCRLRLCGTGQVVTAMPNHPWKMERGRRNLRAAGPGCRQRAGRPTTGARDAAVLRALSWSSGRPSPDVDAQANFFTPACAAAQTCCIVEGFADHSLLRSSSRTERFDSMKKKSEKKLTGL